MEDDLDANVIKNTQLSLGKYVKRPPLSDKLLRKPPFRFLHDIVTSVLKSKAFFEGLFDENELISENIKDRESKIAFLNKVISVVSLTTGKSLSVKPSKVVAGQEPAKTNELLQCLAHALDNNLSSDEAVKQFKLGVKLAPSHSNDKKHKESAQARKKNTESKKLTLRSSEKLVTSEKNGQSVSKSKNKEITALKKESPPRKSLSKVVSKISTQKSKQDGTKSSAIDTLSVKQKTTDAPPKNDEENLMTTDDTAAVGKESSSDNRILQQDINLPEDLRNVETIKQEKQPDLNVNESISKPTSAHKFIAIDDQPNRLEKRTEANLNDSYSLTTNKDETKQNDEETKNQSTPNSDVVSEVVQKDREDSSRLPTTNTFGKNNLNSSNIMRPVSVRPSSSRPGAPRIRDKSDNVINDAESILVGKVNIISENALHEEEENTSIIIENNTTEELYETLQNQEHNAVVGNQNSHLVQQILDSQREFSQISGKTEIQWQFGAQKTPDIFIQEMEQLKFSVQALSRIANPLGKLLDHIQEDVEVMRQELQQWTKIYDETSKDLLKQKNANDESLLPFHTKLLQLTADIEEKHEKITDLKISVHKNSSRIEKLLTNGNVQ